MIKGLTTYSIFPKSKQVAQKMVNSIKAQKQELTKGVKEGYEKGRRLSVQQQRGTIKTAQAKLIGVKRELPPELWYGFLGTLTPLPGGTILGIGLGRLIKVLRNIK